MVNNKWAFVFPGQGSQRLGMGLDFYTHFDVARDVFNEASEALGLDIASLCFSGPMELLSKTQYTQIAVFTATIASLKVVQSELSLVPSYVAGHSLGEYSAIIAAEALAFLPAILLINDRAKFMEEASRERNGGMLAVLGGNEVEIQDICKALSQEGVIEMANMNCPGQIVVSGEERLLDKFSELASSKAMKTKRLNVSGPFHSSLMKKAGERLKERLSMLEIKDPKIPIVANFSAEYINFADEIKEALYLQISSPVLWQQSIQKLICDGVYNFVEIGPGGVLSKLIKRINPDVNVFCVEDRAGLEEFSKRS